MQEKLYTLLHPDYFSTVVLFIFMLMALFLYLTIYYKKISKKQVNELYSKDEKIKSLRQYAYETELKRVDKEHEVEKKILSLNHTINMLETKQKEGLKSQVVTMIEAYEKKRAQQLKVASIRR